MSPFAQFFVSIVMYKLFGYVNEFESHPKSVQYDLALENYLITQCGWISLYTTFAMIMTIENF